MAHIDHTSLILDPEQNQILSFIMTLFHYTKWPEYDSLSSPTVLKLIEEMNKVKGALATTNYHHVQASLVVPYLAMK